MQALKDSDLYPEVQGKYIAWQREQRRSSSYTEATGRQLLLFFHESVEESITNQPYMCRDVMRNLGWPAIETLDEVQEWIHNARDLREAMDQSLTQVAAEENMYDWTAGPLEITSTMVDLKVASNTTLPGNK